MINEEKNTVATSFLLLQSKNIVGAIIFVEKNKFVFFQPQLHCQVFYHSLTDLNFI